MMERNRFESWLVNIFETRDEEISCTECFDLTSGFVEMEISGRNAPAGLWQVKQHLDQCRACRDEYEALRDLVILDNQGNLPSVDGLSALIV
jgi:hypothetical protein